MARKYVFPDVNDRSVNTPSVLVSQQQVLGLYNQTVHSDAFKAVRVDETVQKWFIAEAKRYQWSTAEFLGTQCVLTAVHVRAQRQVTLVRTSK